MVEMKWGGREEVGGPHNYWIPKWKNEPADGAA
jgi:hypothetical protein